MSRPFFDDFDDSDPDDRTALSWVADDRGRHDRSHRPRSGTSNTL
ncbi:hypothetical protein [Halogranum gelatinilyticum]|nr:hypothetical protein [Halogranum gelatinilyticum]